MIAGHHSLMGGNGSAKPPFDWSYDTAMSVRSGLASSLPKLTSIPQIAHTFSSPVSLVDNRFVVLWSVKGGLGVFYYSSTSSSTVLYRVIDTENMSISGVLAEIPTGSARSSFVANPTIDGRILLASRYQGKLWIMDEDGSNVTYLGETYTSWSSSFGIRMYPMYDGTHILFGEDATNGVSRLISTDLTISSGPNMNSTYPYTYIRLPGSVTVTGTTGVVSVFTEDMSTKLVNNRSVASYLCMANMSFMPPKAGEVTWGGESRSKVIGIQVASPYSSISTSTDIVQSSKDGCGTGQCFLPTGQIFIYRAWHNASDTGFYALYDYNSDTCIKLQSADTSYAPRWHWILSTGVLVAYNETQYKFEIYDFKFNPKDCPINLCNGPLGYNGCRSY